MEWMNEWGGPRGESRESNIVYIKMERGGQVKVNEGKLKRRDGDGWDKKKKKEIG